MDLSYIITPFFAWLVTGCLKFLFNSFKEKRFALDLIGYGGFPSNHTSIVSSTVAIVFFNEGIHSPALVVALALAFIVVLDANSLRRQIGKQAEAINLLNRDSEKLPLRERIGHTRVEIIAGAIVGVMSAWVIHLVFSGL
ncbi:divergent PAP2 family protein [Enterovibrio sp. 27052020O]|uniref:divergent PAP2 family protein n=1 Tax=Enterovibrio sp. 27052020O TaxID=3241166 RepID=UPI003890CD67